MTAPVPGPVLVVGCGLIGTSVALGLRARDVEVHLQDLDPRNVALAVEAGAGTDAVVEAPALVVVATPPAAVVDAVRSALASYPQAVVTDVASVKAPIVEAIDDPRFVGGHPMAGKERSGPTAGSGQLFEGRPWAVVPGAETADDAVALVERCVVELGAVPYRFAPRAHDDAVALVSHVPHLMSVLTASLLAGAPEGHVELAGQGLRDVTRIARSDADLWVDIIGHNAAAIAPLLTQVRDRLDTLIDAIGGDPRSLESLLERGRQGTTTIPGKHGTLPTELASVFVPIDDMPGELSRLVGDAEGSVNIEDLRIDHEMGRPVGLVEIVVLPERADKLLDALRGHGWAAYR
ncbi:prephenate dehydrogenase [Aeromicrobium camelliae]|uniref:Prephenate dehydrogenase n=1 Tax=Aeromicrobium camelliae TaxID=1538144 RepID=A0A3N6XWR5_9ACTN|nr:prephenate dehydrogenase [Aeromicrobium camelliae]RQN02144.1 prephenate dehydrogenase [Aeromicrobium camelliae]